MSFHLCFSHEHIKFIIGDNDVLRQANIVPIMVSEYDFGCGAEIVLIAAAYISKYARSIIIENLNGNDATVLALQGFIIIELEDELTIGERNHIKISNNVLTKLNELYSGWR